MICAKAASDTHCKEMFLNNFPSIGGMMKCYKGGSGAAAPEIYFIVSSIVSQCHR